MAKSKTIEKDNEKVIRKISKSELKKYLKNADVDVVSNFTLNIYAPCPSTGEELNLVDYGDSDTVTIDMLLFIKKKARFLLEKGWLVIEDVYIEDLPEDVEIEVKDIYEFLSLGKVYDKIKDLDTDYFDNLLLKEKYVEFEKRVRKMDSALRVVLINRAIDLYKQKEFSDSNKQRILIDIECNETLFSEYDEVASKKKKK